MASHTLAKIAVLVIALSLGASEPLPDSNDKSEACVMQQVYMGTPIQQDFLVYVNPWPHVVLVFRLHGVDDALTRDGVNITNNEMIHSKVRNGRTTEHPLDMPKHIPHGWNTLRVAVAGRSLDVTLVQSEGYVHLLTLALDHDVAQMYMPEAAMCSKVSPEWQVSKGEEVTVLLQPEDNGGGKQWIEVTAGNSAKPYIKFIDEDKKFHVPGNTTLGISISLHWNHSTITVFKDEEEVGSTNTSLTSPGRKLIVGDASHVSLLLSQPPANPICSPTYINSWPLGVGCFMSGVIVMGVISSGLYYFLHQRKNLRRRNTNDGNETPDESGTELLENKNTSDGSEPTVANGNASMRANNRQEESQ